MKIEMILDYPEENAEHHAGDILEVPEEEGWHLTENGYAVEITN